MTCPKSTKMTNFNYDLSNVSKMTNFNYDLFKVSKTTNFNYDLFKISKMCALFLWLKIAINFQNGYLLVYNEI